MTHEIKLGQLIDNPAQQRDAIHIAVAPVVAAQKLKPGQEVGFLGYDTIHVGESDNPIGVVDPFLKRDVLPTQRFFVFLFPNTVTSMRHEWTHPAFVPTESERWLREFAIDLELTYDELMQATKDYLENGKIYCLGIDTPDRVWYDRTEFWYHYEKVTNSELHEDRKEDMFFRCAC